jgi:hypothetical protein
MPYELRNTNIYLVRCARVYIVSIRTHDTADHQKFIVLADNMRAAINMAWEHGGADFQFGFTGADQRSLPIGKFPASASDRSSGLPFDNERFFLAAATLVGGGVKRRFTIHIPSL